MIKHLGEKEYRRNKRTKTEGLRRKMEDMEGNDLVSRIMDCGYDEDEARDFVDEASMYDMEIFEEYFDETDDPDSALDVAQRVDSLDSDEREIFDAYRGEIADDIDEALETVENQTYTLYSGCNDMGDVAYEYVQEMGYDDFVQRYFDYDKLGRDMEIEGTWIETSAGMVQIDY